MSSDRRTYKKVNEKFGSKEDGVLYNKEEMSHERAVVL